MSRTIPEGWFKYTPYGEPIEQTGIIATKTPLKEAFNNGRTREECPGFESDNRVGVPVEDEFTPSQLMLRLQESELTLGMIVDLTFTDRYYSREEFELLGVEYVKLKCPGHEIPSVEVYSKFQKELSLFLNNPKNTNKLVAVHCTHGLNRTGYLVCRYLIQELNYEPEAAIEAFNRSRGYDIERENYLQHLRNGCVEQLKPKRHQSKSSSGAHASPHSHPPHLPTSHHHKRDFKQADFTQPQARRRDKRHEHRHHPLSQRDKWSSTRSGSADWSGHGYSEEDRGTQLTAARGHHPLSQRDEWSSTRPGSADWSGHGYSEEDRGTQLTAARGHCPPSHRDDFHWSSTRSGSTDWSGHGYSEEERGTQLTAARGHYPRAPHQRDDFHWRSGSDHRSGHGRGRGRGQDSRHQQKTYGQPQPKW